MCVSRRIEKLFCSKGAAAIRKSARSKDRVRVKALEQGAVAFLAKPFDGAALLAAIQSALKP